MQSYDDLVQSAKEGDSGSQAELYRRCCSYVLPVVSKILRNFPNDVEDVAVMAAASAILKLDRFDGKSKFQTWLYRIAFNESCMFLRKKSPLKDAESIEIEDEDGASRQVEIVFHERGYAQIEARIDLGKILPQLPVGYREAVELYDLGEMSHKEVAQAKGLSIGNSKSQRFKGIEKARRIMDELTITGPQTTIRCKPCEDMKPTPRFRYADTAYNGIPMCKWCCQDARLSDAKREQVQVVVSGQAAEVAEEVHAETGGKRMVLTKKQKVCGCGCGTSFQPTSNVQKYAPGHKPKPCTVTHTKPVSVAQPVSVARPMAVQKMPLAEIEQKVPVMLSVSAIEEMIMAGSPAQKARALEAMMDMATGK